MTESFNRLQAALADRYRVEREVGRGGMATVYLAEDLKHRRQVAVKVLHPELAAAVGPARFMREIEIAARLTHPHILMLIDSDEVDGFLFYVMPFVDGESLRVRLARDHRIPVPDAIRIVDQVASALDYAHDQGVIHRDIKPENILLAGDQAIVADFGIARAVEKAGGDRLTETGMAVGTPAYMSPEQAFGEANVDGRTDVYAMGCVLFEMIAGHLPYEASSPQGLLARHAAQSIPNLCSLDPAVPLFVERAVSRSLAKEPEQRFDSPGALAETLRSGTVVAPVGRKRVAVLPPVNVTRDPEQQFLALGLHEALISRIGQGPVAVLARTSVLQYQDTEKPIRDICRELSTDAVVESSLFRAGPSVSIQARLIDGVTEEGVWSGSYDGEVNDILSLYRELSGSVANEIHGAMAARHDSGEQPAVDPRVYENYMRGRVCQQSFNPRDLDRAIAYYEAAVAIDPDYAPAWAGMALVWGSRVVLGMVPAREGGEQWVETAVRAAELDPNLAEAQQALAQGYTWFQFDWERAEQMYRRAIDLDPNEPQARIFYAHFLAMLRRPEESDVQIARAMEIDPLNPFTQTMYGVQLGLTGRYQDAIERLETVAPNPLASFALFWAHFAVGSMDEGLRHYVDYFEMLGDQEMVTVMREPGGGPEAAMIRGAETLVARAKQMFVKPNNMVHLFAWGGDTDRAVEWLEHSWEMRDHEIAYLAAMPIADGLRSDPRFAAFLTRLKLPARDDVA